MGAAGPAGVRARLRGAAGRRVVLEYRDVEDAGGADAVAGGAEGVVDVARPGEHLSYELGETAVIYDRVR